MAKSKNGHTRACADLVAFITTAGEAGFSVECRTYASHHEHVTCNVILAEEDGHWRTTQAGGFSLYVLGCYAGNEDMTSASGVGIALAAQAGVIGSEQARRLTTCGFLGNEKRAQTEWLARAERAMKRRKAYSDWLDIGCPLGTFDAYQAAATNQPTTEVPR